MRRPLIRVALIGAGGIGEFHAETLARHVHGARLVAIVDPLRAHAERAALHGESVVISDDAEAMFARDDIDAVVIAAPGRVHRALIELAAAARKHIFCEKPIALTLEDARASVDAVAAAGVNLQIGFQRRFDPAYLRAKQAIDRGDIGNIELLFSTTRDPAPPPPGAVEAAGGIYLDSAIHDFDTLRWFATSEAVDVYATAANMALDGRSGPFDIDTSAATVRFASGAIGVATNTLRTVYGYEAGAEIAGSKGKLVIATHQGGEVQIYGPAGPSVGHPQTYRERFAEAYRAELRDFIRCIIEDDVPAVTGEDSVRAVEIALAATQSQREGRPVRL